MSAAGAAPPAREPTRGHETAMRTSLPLRAAAGALLLVAVAAGCSSKADDADKVAVTATETACEVATTDLAPGSTTFSVTNDGDQVTEVYVYGEGDRIEGEVENVGPGTSRDLTVDLDEGTYEVACKPGMTGDGIRTEITVGS